MICEICCKNKVTKQYSLKEQRIAICRDCIKVLNYKVMETCPECGMSSLVSIDILSDMPRLMTCLCGHCMEEK